MCCLGVIIFVVIELLVLPAHGPELLRASLCETLKEIAVLQQAPRI